MLKYSNYFLSLCVFLLLYIKKFNSVHNSVHDEKLICSVWNKIANKLHNLLINKQYIIRFTYYVLYATEFLFSVHCFLPFLPELWLFDKLIILWILIHYRKNSRSLEYDQGNLETSDWGIKCLIASLWQKNWKYFRIF